MKSAGVVGAAAVAGRSAVVGSARAQTRAPQNLRMISTSVLDIGYEEGGDSAGFPIILLHGFPYDVRSWDGALPPLVDAGYRVLVPYLRGYGATRFRDTAAPRMAEQAAIAQDDVDFADALELDQFALAGFDWGNRAACITAILHPERVRAQVAIGGYSVQNTVTPGRPGSAAGEARLWYQWYFNFGEIGNVLRTYVRRAELESALAQEVYALHLDAPLEVVEPERGDVLATALEMDTTMDDAVFIALARQHGVPLLTAERKTTPWVVRLGRLVEPVRGQD